MGSDWCRSGSKPGGEGVLDWKGTKKTRSSVVVNFLLLHLVLAVQTHELRTCSTESAQSFPSTKDGTMHRLAPLSTAGRRDSLVNKRSRLAEIFDETETDHSWQGKTELPSEAGSLRKQETRERSDREFRPF